MNSRWISLLIIPLGLLPALIQAPVLAADPIEDPVVTFNALWATSLKAKGLAPNPIIDDAAFLRRTYVSIAGRIPMLKESQSFLNDESPDKRFQLIDALLNSDAQTSHLFNWWADLLRIKTNLPAAASGEPYVFWLRDAVARNVHYDEMVQQMLTAEGSMWEQGKGATGYYIRDLGMALDNAANTAQIFLGTRIACAQCHDHPTDIWTRRQFMELTAYTVGSYNRAHYKTFAREAKKSLQGLDLSKAEEIQLKRFARSAAHGVFPRGGGVMRLPKDYQYKDAKPGQPVKAKTIFGETIKIEKDQDPRAVYAKWMTSPKNSRFTTVIANRMFKRAFGIGLIEPVDDFKNGSQSSNPALMAHLEATMKSVQYDLKKFQAMLYKSDLFQRAASTCAPGDEKEFKFQGPVLRRMSAEQIWDSLITLIVDDPEKLKAEPVHPLYVNWDKVSNLRGEELVRMARETSKGREKIQAFNRRLKAIGQEIRAAKKEGDKNQLKKLYQKAAKVRQDREAAQNNQISKVTGKAVRKLTAAEKKARQLMRASELRAPMDPGHLLRQFGQSDREIIENASNRGSVAQVLTLMNGFIDQKLLKSTARFTREAQQATTPIERLDTVYLNILGRRPSDIERESVSKFVANRGTKGLADVAWVLLNSHEFLFLK